MNSLDLWSFENRVFKERKGLLWHIRGLSCSVLLEKVKVGYQRNGWMLCWAPVEWCKSLIPLESCLLHCHTCFPGWDRLRFLQCQNLLQHPVPRRKKSSLTLHACACFSGREPEDSLLPLLPPLDLPAALAAERSTNVQYVWEHWPYVSCWTKNFVPLLCVTLWGQWKTIWSVKSSDSLLFPHSWPSGGPGCDHHIDKVWKAEVNFLWTLWYYKYRWLFIFILERVLKILAGTDSEALRLSPVIKGT